MANFSMIGAALGGLTQGIGQGIRLGREIRDARDEAAIRGIGADALEDARARRNADIAAMIAVEGISGANGGAQRWRVGGNSYASEEEARRAAEAQANPLWDYFNAGGYATRVRDTYLSQGRLEEAQRWDEWAQSRGTQEALGHLGSALRFARTGDAAGVVRALNAAVGTSGYGMDGMGSIRSLEEVSGEDGTSGWRATWVGPDGQEGSQVFPTLQDAVLAGYEFMEPTRAFTSFLDTEAQRRAREADLEDYRAREGIKLENSLILEEQKALRESERSGLSADLQRELAVVERQYGRYDLQSGTVVLDEQARRQIRDHWLRLGRPDLAQYYDPSISVGGSADNDPLGIR